MTAFLTESEVAQLTGIKRGRKRQCEHLRSLGIPFHTNIFGAPIVSRAFIEGKTDKPAANWQPAIYDGNLTETKENEFDGMIPIDWFHKNIYNYLYSNKHIVDNSKPVEIVISNVACGLYFLIDDSKIEYIGITINFNTRLNEHIKFKKFTNVFIIKFPEMFIRHLESIYINALKPPINLDIPPLDDNNKYVKYLKDLNVTITDR